MSRTASYSLRRRIRASNERWTAYNDPNHDDKYDNIFSASDGLLVAAAGPTNDYGGSDQIRKRPVKCVSVGLRRRRLASSSCIEISSSGAACRLISQRGSCWSPLLPVALAAQLHVSAEDISRASYVTGYGCLLAWNLLSRPGRGNGVAE